VSGFQSSDYDNQKDLAHDGSGDEGGDEIPGGLPMGDGVGDKDRGGMINGLPRGFAGLDKSAALAIFTVPTTSNWALICPGSVCAARLCSTI
jgi:hypothetical protein